MNIIGKRWNRSWVLWVTATMLLVLLSAGLTLRSQNTGSLETECVAVVSASSNIVPTSLSPQEFCKVMVALLGNEWEKAAKLKAAIIVVNDHDIRLVETEAVITQIQADLGAIQAQLINNTARITTLEAAPINFQTQIDSINTKLANMAVALQ